VHGLGKWRNGGEERRWKQRNEKRQRHESCRGEGGKADAILHGKYCRKIEKTGGFLFSCVPIQRKDGVGDVAS